MQILTHKLTRAEEVSLFLIRLGVVSSFLILGQVSFEFVTARSQLVFFSTLYCWTAGTAITAICLHSLYIILLLRNGNIEGFHDRIERSVKFPVLGNRRVACRREKLFEVRISRLNTGLMPIYRVRKNFVAVWILFESIPAPTAFLSAIVPKERVTAVIEELHLQNIHKNFVGIESTEIDR